MIRSSVKSDNASRIRLNLALAYRLAANTGKALVGREVLFTRSWRDQPYGHSKKDFFGKIVRIEQVAFDAEARRIEIKPQGCRCFAILMDLSYPSYEQCRLVK